MERPNLKYLAVLLHDARIHLIASGVETLEEMYQRVVLMRLIDTCLRLRGDDPRSDEEVATELVAEINDLQTWVEQRQTRERLSLAMSCAIDIASGDDE